MLGGASAVAASAPAILRLPLDDRTVYQIAISRDVPTTLTFPSALTAIEGANVTASADTPAPVLLAYTPGQHFLSVRALEPGAKGAINVVWRQRTFVLRLAEGAEPSGAVTFVDETRETKPAPVAVRRVTPETLVALLDRAKSHAALAHHDPAAVMTVERATPGSVSHYRDFRVIVEEVFRFDAEDTLVLRLRFENEGAAPVYYLPQRLAARIGLNVYHASIADASGIVPSRAVTHAYFAITGNGTGGRANLSVKNAFVIVVSRVERDAKLIFPE